MTATVEIFAGDFFRLISAKSNTKFDAEWKNYYYCRSRWWEFGQPGSTKQN